MPNCPGDARTGTGRPRCSPTREGAEAGSTVRGGWCARVVRLDRPGSDSPHAAPAGGRPPWPDGDPSGSRRTNQGPAARFLGNPTAYRPTRAASSRSSHHRATRPRAQRQRPPPAPTGSLEQVNNALASLRRTTSDRYVGSTGRGQATTSLSGCTPPPPSTVGPCGSSTVTPRNCSPCPRPGARLAHAVAVVGTGPISSHPVPRLLPPRQVLRTNADCRSSRAGLSVRTECVFGVALIARQHVGPSRSVNMGGRHEVNWPARVETCCRCEPPTPPGGVRHRMRTDFTTSGGANESSPSSRATLRPVLAGANYPELPCRGRDDRTGVTSPARPPAGRGPERDLRRRRRPPSMPCPPRIRYRHPHRLHGDGRPLPPLRQSFAYTYISAWDRSGTAGTARYATINTSCPRQTRPPLGLTQVTGDRWGRSPSSTAARSRTSIATPPSGSRYSSCSPGKRCSAVRSQRRRRCLLTSSAARRPPLLALGLRGRTVPLSCLHASPAHTLKRLWRDTIFLRRNLARTRTGRAWFLISPTPLRPRPASVNGHDEGGITGVHRTRCRRHAHAPRGTIVPARRPAGRPVVRHSTCQGQRCRPACWPAAPALGGSRPSSPVPPPARRGDLYGRRPPCAWPAVRRIPRLPATT